MVRVLMVIMNFVSVLSQPGWAPAQPSLFFLFSWLFFSRNLDGEGSYNSYEFCHFLSWLIHQFCWSYLLNPIQIGNRVNGLPPPHNPKHIWSHVSDCIFLFIQLWVLILGLLASETSLGRWEGEAGGVLRNIITWCSVWQSLCVYIHT